MTCIMNILVDLVKINNVDYKTVKQENILYAKITIKFPNIFKYALSQNMLFKLSFLCLKINVSHFDYSTTKIKEYSKAISSEPLVNIDINCLYTYIYG